MKSLGSRLSSEACIGNVQQFLMMASPLRFTVLVLILGMFCYGVYDILTNDESNGCEMTYMYEIPEYMVGCFSFCRFRYSTRQHIHCVSIKLIAVAFATI